jgi:hypothetical protein
MLTVACVWVEANVPYGVEYVVRLRAMVARQLARPHRFVCLTDRVHRLPADLEAQSIVLPRGFAGWWAKVLLFHAARDLGPRVLYLDLDTLVVGALDPVVDYPAPFALVPDAGTFTPRTAHRVIKRFNSSVMVWSAGAVDALYDAWTPDVADRLWGDQDWIGEQQPDAATMPRAWFPRLSDLHGQPPGADEKVVLAKKPKNHEAAQRWPWVDQVWRAVA